MRIKLKLKKIDPVKAGVIHGILLALMALIIIVPMFLIMSAAGLSGGGNPGLAMFGGGAAMFIAVPLLYGILGFFVGLIGTALLNFVLTKTKGLDIDFDSDNLEIAQIGKLESDLKF